MRAMAEIVIPILLVGCLIAAVVVAGEHEQECDGPYKGRTLTSEELETTLRDHLAWLKAKGKPDDKRRANFCQAGLRGANFQGAWLDGANLCQADLSQANLHRAHLVGANLQEAFLHEANLEGAFLHEANLEGAFLHEANLQGAFLSEANLQGASLYRANLQGAGLRGANFQGAWLDGANLCQADLSQANLHRAHLVEANLCQADLSQANLQGAFLHETNLEGARLRGADLEGARLDGAKLQGVNLGMANLLGVILRGANLQRAYLAEANLQGAFLHEANLEGARLEGADLQEAFLHEADLQEAFLRGANLQGARLEGANLQGAWLEGANLQGAKLDRADLAGARFEIQPASLPNVPSLARAANLHQMTFHTSPHALVELREAFKDAGLRKQERQLTYAIERTKRLQAWDPSWYYPQSLYYPQGEDQRPWLGQLAGKSESLFSYALFELPSAYGMAPGRALWGLLGLIPIFALPYWLAIKRANSRSGIWMILPGDRLASRSGKQKAVLLRPPIAKTWWERLASEARMLRTGLYFSFLSAFHLGWREFNVGTWITHMQPREYTLRATGWVRTVSGIQSLLSVYLLALWVLTYFSRPFE